MKKVDELTELELDYWAAKAYQPEDKFWLPDRYDEYNGYLLYDIDAIAGKRTLRLKIDWNFIMPIVEREKIEIRRIPYNKTNWQVFSDIESKVEDKDLLTALKRCIVKIKYGEEVG